MFLSQLTVSKGRERKEGLSGVRQDHGVYECSWFSKTNVLEGKQFGPKENKPSTYPEEISGL